MHTGGARLSLQSFRKLFPVKKILRLTKPTAALRCLIGFRFWVASKLQLRCAWGAVASVEGARHSRLSLHALIKGSRLERLKRRPADDAPKAKGKRSKGTLFSLFTVHFRWQEGTTCARDLMPARIRVEQIFRRRTENDRTSHSKLSSEPLDAANLRAGGQRLQC